MSTLAEIRRSISPGESIRGGAEPSGSTLDVLLSGAELLCLAPPAICSAVCAVRLVVARGGPVKPFAALASGRTFIMHYVLLVGAVAIGVLVRRKQWERLCRVGAGAGASDTGGVDLVGRVEKVEESVRGVLAAVVVLSRTVEKLGVRFRVLRRTLRDPISETAALAEKNSEATRILAAQEDLLEKEISSIQKVLYAMQEQQEKQLKLILAIGEASRILDDKQDLLG
ncbi:hypothetical protein D1007_35736 [Hordeum vulgare]|nr:hypothetical protein D1007_35736 [Hordeum vulgare]